MASGNEPLRLGRYVLYDEIASGGMASVHLGRLAGSAGFARTVAIKRLHPHCAKDAEFVSMFIDEARLAARIKHPNVVPTLDVVRDGDELFIVMEYISGESLSRLLISARKRGSETSLRLITPVMAQTLHGLHAAHTATDEQGKLLGIVHRDVSPQNIIVSTAGIAHVLDFGVAKARGRLQTTREGQIKGKLAYMPPEQLRGESVSATSDLYAAGVVLWEALAGRRLFRGENEGAIVTAVLRGTTIAPSHHRSNVTADLDAITMKALDLDPAKRFQNARQMAAALENAIHGAGATEIGEWVQEEASQSLLHRAARISDIESGSDSGPTSGRSPLDHSWTGPQQAELATTRLSTDPNAQENTNIAVTQRTANRKLTGRAFHPLHAAALAVVVLLVG
ncbi:MAG: serine/threonine-protein kinase, partial [Polyangiaceae bacterium]